MENMTQDPFLSYKKVPKDQERNPLVNKPIEMVIYPNNENGTKISKDMAEFLIAQKRYEKYPTRENALAWLEVAKKANCLPFYMNSEENPFPDNHMGMAQGGVLQGFGFRNGAEDYVRRVTSAGIKLEGSQANEDDGMSKGAVILGLAMAKGDIDWGKRHKEWLEEYKAQSDYVDRTRPDARNSGLHGFIRDIQHSVEVSKRNHFQRQAQRAGRRHYMRARDESKNDKRRRDFSGGNGKGGAANPRLSGAGTGLREPYGKPLLD